MLLPVTKTMQVKEFNVPLFTELSGGSKAGSSLFEREASLKTPLGLIRESYCPSWLAALRGLRDCDSLPSSLIRFSEFSWFPN